ncbi:transcriptional regulator, MarR family [Bordetella petrii]|uniref:Transcriptional regulator, MarR family n=1 Tax=Bordetella petrii (strain ATCC BAA-461 / DSM 12804 / CCUG 43448 / CIP 107267 / Se-1111R) TaxID=340100 RepID=A9IJH0_BORPD|nr:transcriptional regulator, MarR family [Bordetella petrii]
MAQISERLVNLVGALALGVTDRMRAAVAEAMSLGGETVAAVIVIGHSPTLSIDQLSRILRLSHAGAVRLVDRLVERGFVEKRPSALDRRTMSLALTPSGSRQRDELLALRKAALEALLAHVSAQDLEALERIAETVVAKLPDDALSALTTCRYCDERSCASCPMEAFGSLDTPCGSPSRT